jgi:NitT/TauT family transport system substrate-binding protein
VVAAMIGGSLDVGQLGGPGLVNAGMGGADVAMFAGFLNKEDYRLMSDPSIKTLAELKGKTVAITSFGAADDFILRKVLVANNLTPDTDVKIIAAKDTPGQMAALASKQVQAAVFGLPNYVTAQKQGAAVLLDLSAQKILHQSTGLVATRGWLKAHHSAALKLVQATTEGMQRFKDDKAFAEMVMSKYIKSDDKDVLDAGWQSNAAAFQIPPLPSADGVQEILDEVKGGDAHKPQEFIDTSIVQELQASGYFK